MATTNTQKNHKKRHKNKLGIPKEVPIASARRAVEFALKTGYFLAVSDWVGSRNLPNAQPISVKKVFSESNPLVDPSLATYEPIIEAMNKFVEVFSGSDLIDACIADAHNAGKNRPGRPRIDEALLEESSKRSRRQRSKRESD